MSACPGIKSNPPLPPELKRPVRTGRHAVVVGLFGSTAEIVGACCSVEWASALSLGSHELTPQGGPWNLRLLVKRCDVTRGACRVVRPGFQHLLADASHCRQRPWAYVATIFTPVLCT